MRYAIVLCGTVPHILLLNKLKKKGYKTVLIDYNNSAPAIPYADEFVLESAFDKEAIIKIAQNYNAELVISSCSEQANSVCCYVAEKLNLPHPYSYETSLDVTDKGRMKAIFFKGNVPSSEFAVFSDIQALTKHKPVFPVVVKPVDAYSSKGVRKADNYDDMIMFGKEAMQISKAGRIIVEGYCPGIEIQVDCVAIDGKAHVLMTRSKSTMSQDSIELNSKGSTVPANMSKEENDQAIAVAQRICDAFKLKNTPFFYQARLYCGKISVLEFAPRIGGGLSFQMVKRATGVDIVDLSINSFLGEKLSLEGQFEKCKSLATILLYMEPGVFGEVRGLDTLEQEGIIDYYSVLKKKGSVVGSDRTSSNRAGMVMISADSQAVLEEKKLLALDKIKILDIDGNNKIIQ